ncbi:hypothetical protein B9479_007600 [Cryptococcus floricola]|uniref:Uncharacterized protein n=1 Tax=Cryptococcus floricola TaxID=2591691 RepID=A0A5D3AJU8_9TREE|nr:hypothetical protein B9479_007600 [Cryptococcus floricola]
MSIQEDNFSSASDGSDIHEEPTPSAEQGWNAGSIVMSESTGAGSVERTQGWTGDAELTARVAVFDGYSTPDGENAGDYDDKGG